MNQKNIIIVLVIVAISTVAYMYSDRNNWEKTLQSVNDGNTALSEYRRELTYLETMVGKEIILEGTAWNTKAGKTILVNPNTNDPQYQVYVDLDEEGMFDAKVLEKEIIASGVLRSRSMEGFGGQEMIFMYIENPSWRLK